MKNISIRGLQRSGTNYLKSLIDKNIIVNAFSHSVLNDGTLEEFDYTLISDYLKNDCVGKRPFDLWKHNINTLNSTLIQEYNIDGFILIIKNPYSWIESIVYRKTIDIVITYGDKYNLLENGELSISNLINLYKDFYSNWLNAGAFLIKYEDLLLYKEFFLIEFAKKFNLSLKLNKIEDINFFVEQSSNFDYSLIDKYINVDLSYLNKIQIDTINRELGNDFFNKIGYKIKSPN
jgi:hypothetical protein